MHHPSPAIVAQSAVRAFPRWALWLLCSVYVAAGFIGRDPWKKHDIEAYGFMLQLARGEGGRWLQPLLLGMPDPHLSLLPTWLGALFIRWAPAGWETTAARLPFALMLISTLLATWYAVYALARHKAAQPVAFAFGGEARPTDYARALADGAVLALLACLGLAQLSHEITPALSQLCFSAWLFMGMAMLPRKKALSLSAIGLGMLGLSLSGAPTLALLLALGGGVVRALAAADSDTPRLRPLDIGLLALLTLICVTLNGALGLWRWRLMPLDLEQWQSFGRLLLWFTWPAGPLALWSLWRWRRQLLRPWLFAHIGLPFWFALVTVVTAACAGLSDRALMAALPAIAALAAFALPTLRCSVGALIDWFTLLFFSLGAVAIWVVWFSLQTGWPAQPARNVARAAPEFVHTLSLPTLLIALLATLAWLGLVRWRTGRHRSALWKSLVLPAAGTTLCWCLLMTLWLPLLNHARSYAPLVAKIQALTGPQACVQIVALNHAQTAALLAHSTLQIHRALLGPHASRALPPPTPCPWLLIDSAVLPDLANTLRSHGWQEQHRLRRPTDNDETLVLMRTNRSETPARD